MQNDFNYEDNQAGPKPRGGAANRLVPDVPTRWNSSYLMFRRLLQLRQACDEFCKTRDFKKFAPLPAKWEYVQQMCDLLEPLSAATEIICRSKFPTMQQVVPVYIVVIQELKSVSYLSEFIFSMFIYVSQLFILLILFYLFNRSIISLKKKVVHKYDYDQLVPASKKMIMKLEDYFKKVLSKPGPICATILDPRLKLNTSKSVKQKSLL